MAHLRSHPHLTLALIDCLFYRSGPLESLKVDYLGSYQVLVKMWAHFLPPQAAMSAWVVPLALQNLP